MDYTQRNDQLEAILVAFGIELLRTNGESGPCLFPGTPAFRRARKQLVHLCNQEESKLLGMVQDALMEWKSNQSEPAVAC